MTEQACEVEMCSSCEWQLEKGLYTMSEYDLWVKTLKQVVAYSIILTRTI